jgi:hypothetical protein
MLILIEIIHLINAVNNNMPSAFYLTPIILINTYVSLNLVR